METKATHNFDKCLFRMTSVVWRKNWVFLLFLDILSISGCFLLSYYIRFYIQIPAIETSHAGLIHRYLKTSLLLALIWIYFVWRNSGYKNDLLNIGHPILMIRSVVMSGMYALSILMVFSFMFREMMLLSRQIYLMAGVLACAMMLITRMFFFPKIAHYLAKRGFYRHRMTIIGLNELGTILINNIRDMDANIQIAGYIGQEKHSFAHEKIPYLGGIQDIENIWNNTGFDVLVISNSEKGQDSYLPEVNKNDLMNIINFCEMHNVNFYMLSGSYNMVVAQDEIGSFAGHPIFCLRDACLHPAYAFAKRGMDFLVAIIGILIGMPVWLCVALLIKLTSKGPVFFTQVRAGINGKPFKMYKFRSMVADAEDRLKHLIDIDKLDEPVFKIKNDPRVTLIGRFLRQTSLDEIPQVINVLKGEMSLVGPRPEELCMVEKYNLCQQRRLKAKPGITGYQQIMNRGETSLSERIKYDLIYLKNQGLFMDLYILLMTVFVVVKSKGTTH
ncbi:MAG: sugar transferase [Desulfobacteraceae bacterium]|nr:sugar transferase [Desulfobacteraceae bacterium]